MTPPTDQVPGVRGRTMGRLLSHVRPAPEPWSPSIATTLVGGALAGASGTALLEALAPIERAIVGGPLPFSPPRIARRLVSGGRRARVVARALRWSYGPGWGIVWALARRRVSATRKVLSRRSQTSRALLLAGAILGLELVALPALVGARNLYRPRTLAALALHVAAFAGVVVGGEDIASG